MDSKKNAGYAIILALFFIIMPRGAQAQAGDVCATPTRVHTPTPYATLTPIATPVISATITPFPTPTVYTYSIAFVEDIAETVITYTGALTTFGDAAYGLVTSATLVVEETTITYMIGIVKAVFNVSTLLSGFLGVITFAVVYKLAFEGLVTTTKATKSLTQVVKDVLKMIAPNWQTLALVGAVAGAIYGCNRVF